MESDNRNIITSCRICREFTSPHKVTFEYENEWSRLYEYCFGLQLPPYGPQAFCKSCSEKLNDYGNFKQLCLQSEEMWKSNCTVDTTIVKTENIEVMMTSDCMHHDNNDDYYGSDGTSDVVKEEKDEMINHFAINVKDEKDQLQSCNTSSNECDLIIKQEATKIYCGICDYCSNSQTEVDQHFAQHCHDNDLNCRLCSFQGNDMGDMVLHRYTHTEKDKEPKFICPLCSKQFLVDLKLSFHYRLEHLKQKGAACKFCGKTFLDYYRWTKHEKLHVITKYTCDHCGAGFMDRHGIKSHLAIHSDVLNFTCDFCGQGFKARRNLKAHVFRKHTESKKETCTICYRQFNNRLTLQTHYYSYHKERKYLCPVCAKDFCTKTLLKTHFLSHTDEKPHGCDLCDARFKKKDQLTIHKRKHTGEIPYRCAECGKGFANLSTCKRHQNNHADRIKCPHCEKTFYSKKYMLNHCSAKHKDTVENAAECLVLNEENESTQNQPEKQCN